MPVFYSPYGIPFTREQWVPWDDSFMMETYASGPLQGDHPELDPMHGNLRQTFSTPGSSQSSLQSEIGIPPDGSIAPPLLSTLECPHLYGLQSSWADVEVAGHRSQWNTLESLRQVHLAPPSRLRNPAAPHTPRQTEKVRKDGKLSALEKARNENGKFICAGCGKPYARRERMETCQSKHKNLRTHHCNGGCGVDDCEMSYASPDCLRRHQWPLERRRVTCEICKCLTSKQNLARHKSRCLLRV